MKNEYISVREVADLLHISRQAIIKRINNGQLQAVKIGNNYAIAKSEFIDVLQQKMSEKNKQEIEGGVKMVIKEYGEVLKLLGKE